MSSVVATLMDLRWIPREPDKWKSLAGFAGGTFTNILDEGHLCTVNMEWTKASTHLDGNGLEHGVDMCGYHKQHAWLARKDLRGKAGLMKAAAAGGLWPAARLRAADERYDGLCPRCLAEGFETEETMLNRVWQCPPATQRAEFSVQKKNGARKRRSSKNNVPAFGCEVWFPKHGQQWKETKPLWDSSAI